MRLRQPDEEAILSSEEIAMVRQVLVDCSRLLTTAQDLAGAPLAEATRAATAAKRSPDGMLYDLNLAIDYLDFAPPARGRR